MHSQKEFDHETETFIGFTIYAIAKNATSMKEGHIHLIDVNDNSPYCTSSTTYLNIDSNTAIGEEVFRTECIDDDDGINAFITYTLDSNYFVVDEYTGVLRVQRTLEDVNQIKVNVIATDHGIPMKNTTIRIIFQVDHHLQVLYATLYLLLI